jgi:hypothetical protein
VSTGGDCRDRASDVRHFQTGPDEAFIVAEDAEGNETTAECR